MSSPFGRVWVSDIFIFYDEYAIHITGGYSGLYNVSTDIRPDITSCMNVLWDLKHVRSYIKNAKLELRNRLF